MEPKLFVILRSASESNNLPGKSKYTILRNRGYKILIWNNQKLFGKLQIKHEPFYEYL